MEHANEIHGEAWAVNPRLDMPDLFPPAVMFSIHDSDPQVKFKDALGRLSEAKHHHTLGPLPQLTPSMMRQLTLRSAWDSVFHHIPGDRMVLLCQIPALPSGAKPGEHTVHAVVIKSTEPAGKKWIATRATEFHGKAVCWCVPVDVEKGTRVEVVLTADTMITLESA
jgi:hypothetical protein